MSLKTCNSDQCPIKQRIVILSRGNDLTRSGGSFYGNSSEKTRWKIFSSKENDKVIIRFIVILCACEFNKHNSLS